MKKMRLMAILLLIVVAFCACGDKSKGEDTGMVEDFILQWFSANYTDAEAYICSDVVSEMGAAELEIIAADTVSSYGAFQEINGVVESNVQYFLDSMGLDPESASANLEAYDVYYASVVFENSDIGIFILVDKEEHLVYGVTICGSEDDGGYHSHGGKIHKHQTV